MYYILLNTGGPLYGIVMVFMRWSRPWAAMTESGFSSHLSGYASITGFIESSPVLARLSAWIQRRGWTRSEWIYLICRNAWVTRTVIVFQAGFPRV